MLEELERLIKFIEQEYFEFNKQWKESNYYYEINLRKKTINDLIDDNILNAIFNYREFINEKNTKLIIDFMHFNTTKAKVNVRTKTRNSIEYKKENYIANHNNGEIPINKCFNDLFGIRIICMEELSKEQVLLLLNELTHQKRNIRQYIYILEKTILAFHGNCKYGINVMKCLI